MDAFRLFQRRRLAIAADAGLEVMLHANRPLRLVRARGGRIVCTAGCAWITAPDVPGDIFLHAGETWDIAGDGLVLVEALGSAMVAIAPGNRASPPVCITP